MATAKMTKTQLMHRLKRSQCHLSVKASQALIESQADANKTLGPSMTLVTRHQDTARLVT